jgi:hypothetical protein
MVLISDLSDQEIIEKLPTTDSWAKLWCVLNISTIFCGRRVILLKQKLETLGLSTSHFICTRYDVTDDVFETCVRESTSMLRLTNMMGYKGRVKSPTYLKIKRRILELGLSTVHFKYKLNLTTNKKTRSTPKQSYSNKIDKFDDDHIRTIVRDSSSITMAIRNFGYMATNRISTKSNLRHRIASLKIDTSHWKTRKSKPNSELFVANKVTNALTLIPRLLKDFAWSYECRRCKCVGSDWTCVDGVLLWDGEPMKLQLDHINGDHADNRIENLRFLCANCHTLTPTFTSKNTKKAIANRKWVSRKCLHGEPAPESPVGP